jgi:demethylmenaquinone methyltransferase/2-methoxy-6-polyprenyl-1,4-benzoquinol methylase
MFDAIAPRYDALNHLLSAGLDRRWRRRATRELRLTGAERLLDVCTGTGDLAIAAVAGRNGRARDVIAIDFAPAMLRLGLAKIRRAGLGNRIHLARADATAVPLPDASCDAVSIGFGIRNVVDPGKACEEFARVLRPGGRLAVLEFGTPGFPACRSLYQWYFGKMLPRIGRVISGHADAYSYLPASVAEFPPPDEFARTIQRAGFQRVRHISLSLGIVSLFIGERDLPKQ